MKRRDFFQLSAGMGLALGLPLVACTRELKNVKLPLSNFEKLAFSLLTEWCDGMISVQINRPDDLSKHGALFCPGCNKIHGRCMDAVYPFLALADQTGDQKYLNAAIDVMTWADNVSMPDGSWTVIPDPNSWKGITVFGAIALGEALHHHGQVLPEEVHKKWMQRLAKAAEFIHEKITTISYSHVNYAFTAVYALNFIGRILKNETYIAQSKALANEVPNWLTKPNNLIFGENHPIDKLSDKGLPSVDLGYNVEETLNGLVQYAVLENDEELLQLLTKSMESHLEFMLPDGAWDNSWGTRQNKWSYWGSRTTDGCQPAFGLMATRNNAFGTAAFLNTELLNKCTVNGLLAGGLHYESHGVQPCVHHTFAHAKSLAFILDNSDKFRHLSKEAPIPRANGNGVKHFPEIDVWLVARGPWRATVSSYDAVFKKKYSQAATGGSLAVLWHQKVGPIFTASMAEYLLVEENNQQPQPDGEDIPLTPRIECFDKEQWFSNLFDLKAGVDYSDNGHRVVFDIVTKLTNREGQVLEHAEFELKYTFDKDKTVITAKRRDFAEKNSNTQLTLPILSPTGEILIQKTSNQIEIHKVSSKILLKSTVPLIVDTTKKERVFNMVPGMEAIPIKAHFSKDIDEIACTIEVE